MVDEEDEDTLQAIDAGIRDVEAGRVVSIESVRGFLGQWMTESSSRKNLLRDS
jgi:predicted transcriptional regulator